MQEGLSICFEDPDIEANGNEELLKNLFDTFLQTVLSKIESQTSKMEEEKSGTQASISELNKG